MICMVSTEGLSSQVVEDASVFASVHNASAGAAVLEVPKHQDVAPAGLSAAEFENVYVLVPPCTFMASTPLALTKVTDCSTRAARVAASSVKPPGAVRVYEAVQPE